MNTRPKKTARKTQIRRMKASKRDGLILEAAANLWARVSDPTHPDHLISAILWLQNPR